MKQKPKITLRYGASGKTMKVEEGGSTTAAISFDDLPKGGAKVVRRQTVNYLRPWFGKPVQVVRKRSRRRGVGA